MGIADRLSAFGRGAAQGATGGFVDELYPKILDALPREDDNTGIPREYAGGSAEKQMRDEYRADDADAAQKYPLNYGAGAMAGAAPVTVATGGGIMGSSLGAGAKLAALGLAGGAEGAVHGAGTSEASGKQLASDAAKSAAISSLSSMAVPELAMPVARSAARAAAPGQRGAIANRLQAFGNSGSPSFTEQALTKLKGKFPPPPSGPSAEPALATAGTSSAASMPSAELGGVQVNRMVPPRPPPRPNTADLHDIVPSSGLTEEEEFARKAIDGRASYPPVDVSKPLPKNPAWKHRNGVPDEEVDALEQRLRQTEESGQKRIEAGIQNRNNPPAATVRPGKRGKPAAKPEPTGLARSTPDAPTAPALASADRPLVGPKQLSDDRILELARQGREAAGPQAPQGAKGLTPEQLEQGKQLLRDEFKKMSSGGNVVQLDDAIQTTDPVVAGRVREFQQHAKAAEAAGDSDQAGWFKNQIEELLSEDHTGKAQAR